tara:strand:- start:112 stop:456 length:345 start_codon:yes stop_codon:yes gene_type:complete
MNEKLYKIKELVNLNKINEALKEISKLGPEFHNDGDYLFLRSKIFFLSGLYYLAVDTLLIALEFKQSDEIYNLLAEIYKILENYELSKKILDLNSREEAIKSVKDELTGVYRKK